MRISLYACAAALTIIGLQANAAAPIVQGISVDSKNIRINLSTIPPADCVVWEVAPYNSIPTGAVFSKPDKKSLVISRYEGQRDRLTSGFEVKCDRQLLDGVRYVTDFKNISKYHASYPVVKSIKGLQVVNIPDAVSLGVKHAAINLNQGDFMVAKPEAGCIKHQLNGQTFYFDGNMVTQFDKRVKELSDNGVLVTLILLNSKTWVKPMP